MAEVASLQNFSHVWLGHGFSYFSNHLGGDLDVFLMRSLRFIITPDYLFYSEWVTAAQAILSAS